MENMQPTINKFGKKMKELCDVVAADPNWRDYVEGSTVTLIEDLFTIQNLTAVSQKHNLTYTNIRAKYMVALERIKAKKTDKIRNGKSNKARHLLELLEETKDWEVPLTEREIAYATLFKQYKNFYEVGRILKTKPSNVAGTLYGTNQRLGVIGKIEKYKATNGGNI